MAHALWTQAEALAATGGAAVPAATGAAAEWVAHGVSIDTRQLQPGDLFIALKGPNHDGHDYLAAAFEAGAAAALVHRLPEGPADALGPLLQVGETLEGLERLGVAARERSGAKRIGVTGSMGKTGTKELLRTAFEGLLPTSGAPRVHASVASFNNHWGVPLTLARLPREAEIGIFEMGMNHAGEITVLSGFVQPDIAIITTIGSAHIEFFDSIEGIAHAKAEIFDGMAAGGVAIVNGDVPQSPILIEAARTKGLELVRFGQDRSCDVCLIEWAPTPAGASAVVSVFGQRIEFDLSFDGKHWALNAAACLAAVKAAGFDPAAAAQHLGRLTPPAGRGQRTRITVAGGQALLIDESYNANPDSMAAALGVLGAIPRDKSGRRVAVLGDMLELGEQGGALHAGLLAAIEAAGIDRVFLCGPLMAHLWECLPTPLRGAYKPNARDLADLVVEDLTPGDVVMVKGSNGSKTSVIVERLRGLAMQSAEGIGSEAAGERDPKTASRPTGAGKGEPA